MSDDPSIVSVDVQKMRAHWAIVSPLMGGTGAMRAAGEELLPRWPAEDSESYRCRLMTSTLLPAYSETVVNMGSRVFAEPIHLMDDVPARLREYWQDIDQQGNNGTVFGRGWFEDALAKSISFVYVDYPQNPASESEGETIVTEADVIATGARPYAIHIRPEQVLGWKESGGQLLQFRYEECVYEDEGTFGQKAVPQIRVLEPGSWAIYRHAGKDGWYVHEEGASSLTYIPIVPFYTKRTGFLTGKPPLMELAYLNVKHWQSQSDQDTILHYARVPILFGAGFEQEHAVVVGGGTLVKNDKIEAKLSYVEHEGKAIDAGRNSLKDLIDEMRIAGAKLLRLENAAPKTAEQAQEDAAIEMSPLQMMSGQFEDSVAQVLQIMADYIGETEGGHVQVRGNFETDYVPETTMPLLLNMAAQGRLSDQTLFNEYQRRGVLSSELDWDSEKERIDQQGPPLGLMGAGSGNG
ncbi:DUF4055 domain-containing protein [Pseudomonas citronellolis]|uniref:DUF4055 domain-containing protein n=1 Tax=Pseudomonas citronellolis TaxID=53408 RepID=UPI0007183571|nr:DUF4055 domain-containing protein [Pseudomonas citronellolis]KRV72614.1 DNA-binding protein [Pseudomonas citronellolis]KRW77704.1 DNA-binding protein [Pseudomonas citronellolis]